MAKKAFKNRIIYLFIVLFVATALIIWASSTPTLYEKYAISRVMPVPVSAESKPNIVQAANLFNTGDYLKAKRILQPEYMEHPQNPFLSYYFAITLIETGKAYEARTILMPLNKKQSLFTDDAAYYIALSFLKHNQWSFFEKVNKPEAIEWLKKVPAGTPNASKAQALIAELEQ